MAYKNHQDNLRYGREYYKKNRLIMLENNRKHYKENRERSLSRIRKSKYGISLEEYKKMIRNQKNKCAVCFTKLIGDRNRHVDHNHKTNKVRGLLCKKCNLALGLLNEDLKIIQGLIKYLRKYEH